MPLKTILLHSELFNCCKTGSLGDSVHMLIILPRNFLKIHHIPDKLYERKNVIPFYLESVVKYSEISGAVSHRFRNAACSVFSEY